MQSKRIKIFENENPLVKCFIKIEENHVTIFSILQQIVGNVFENFVMFGHNNCRQRQAVCRDNRNCKLTDCSMKILVQRKTRQLYTMI